MFLPLMKKLLFFALSLSLAFTSRAQPANPAPHTPVKIIFDTDVGNDVDDVIALSVLHALQSRGDCEILAVTVTKTSELAAPFVDAMDTFYGRSEIPIGAARPRPGEDEGKYLRLVDAVDNGAPEFPHRLKRGSDAEEATHLLRRILAEEPDHSVVLAQVGYFSNFAALLSTKPDAVSPLSGMELAKEKVKMLCVMAGSFRKHMKEFNVMQDLPAAKDLVTNWPTPIVWSGFEIGVAVPYPARSIEHDFSYVKHHPTAEAYYAYMPPPHERPCWDPTCVLYAVCPDRGYFDLSPPGQVRIDAEGYSTFEPKADGRDRCLLINATQAARVREALVQLATQPPNRLMKK